ncbi:MAG: hypothetical protein M1818_004283 [Claussenomyces sp. TS43310]|nr:MAG: hypothetical protein M1818_004283 [Claussenomyces sp. TS43310]
MRYSYAALVLATATIGQVCAGPLKHSHMHFHDKKDAAALEVAAEVEKKDLSNVDWADVKYTFSAGQTWGAPTPAAPAAPAATTAAAAVAETTAASVSASYVASTSSASSVSASSASTNDVASTISTLLTDVDNSLLTALGALSGLNAKDSSGGVWIGDDGPYTMDVTNSAGEDVVLVGWGAAGSWVNAKQPLITVSVPQNQKVTLSFANGQSGALSAIYKDTKLVNGQVSNTWTEFTFQDSDSTVDVSREVLMTGHSMEVVTPQCTTNMNTCVFVCQSGDTCETGYTLSNCAIGSQPGANTDAASQNGGCSGMGSSAKLTMTLS